MTDHAARSRGILQLFDELGEEDLRQAIPDILRAVEAEALEKAADDAAIEGLGQAITGWLRTRAGAIRAVKP